MTAGRTGEVLRLLLILIAVGSVRQLSGQTWIRIGGDLNPMGERNPVAFAKLGLLIEGSTHPFTDATALLVIQCTTATPPPVSVVLNDGPYLRRAEGQARIVPRLPHGSDAPKPEPPHAIRWSASGNISLAFLSGEESKVDPQYVDLRQELQDGDTLTISVDTSSGTLYYRFSLDGFEVQENLCPGGAAAMPPLPTIRVAYPAGIATATGMLAELDTARRLVNDRRHHRLDPLLGRQASLLLGATLRASPAEAGGGPRPL